MHKRTLYLFTLVLLIWFGASLLSAKFGVLNPDEAFYLTASHMVFQGRLPYRDFAFTQGPLMPYVYGALLWLLGPELAIGRFVSVAFSLVASALVLNITHRLAGTRAALFACVFLIATPFVLYYLSIAKPHSLVATLMLLALALVLHRGHSPSDASAFLSTLIAGLAAMTRVSFLPLVGLVFIYWVWRGRWRASGLGLLLPVVSMVFLAANSDGNLLFDILEFHLRRVRATGSIVESSVSLALASAVAFGPAVVVMIFLGMLWWRAPAVRAQFARWWRDGSDFKLLVLAVMLALGFVHFSGPAESWEYQVPGFLLLVILLAGMTAPIGDLRRQPAWTMLLSICLVGASLTLWHIRIPALWPTQRATNTLVSAHQASAILAQRGGPGDTVLGEFNHLALAAGLQVYPGNEMGLFSVADGPGPADAIKRRFLSKEAVTEVLDNCTTRFVAVYPDGLFPVSLPSFQNVAEETKRQWSVLLHDKYREIYTDDEVTIYERIGDKCNAAIPSTEQQGDAVAPLVGSDAP